MSFICHEQHFYVNSAEILRFCFLLAFLSAFTMEKVHFSPSALNKRIAFGNVSSNNAQKFFILPNQLQTLSSQIVYECNETFILFFYVYLRYQFIETIPNVKCRNHRKKRLSIRCGKLNSPNADDELNAFVIRNEWFMPLCIALIWEMPLTHKINRDVQKYSL